MKYKAKLLPGGQPLGRIYTAKAATNTPPTAPSEGAEGVIHCDGYQWVDLDLQVAGNDVDVKLWKWNSSTAAWVVVMHFGVNGSLTLDQTNFAAQERSVEVTGADWLFLQVTAVGGAGTLTADAYGSVESNRV